jgi:hypothetical protein
MSMAYSSEQRRAYEREYYKKTKERHRKRRQIDARKYYNKHKKRRLEYAKEYKKEKGARQLERDRQFRQANKSQMLLRRGGKCVDCGLMDARVLTFDHRDPRQKTRKVAALMTAAPGTVRFAKLLLEVDLCDVRCHNCHFIRTITEGHNVFRRK